MVSITPITVNSTPSIYRTQFVTSPKISFKGKTDTFTKSENNNFEYQDSWHLKGKEIVAQNDFTTTIEEKRTEKGFLGFKKTVKENVEYYDLPIRLAEDIKRDGDSLIKVHIAKDALDETGLSNEEFLKEIEKINGIIKLTHPRYDMYEDETHHAFEMKIGKSNAKIARVAQGLSGVVYRISIPNCKPLALKQYFGMHAESLIEGAIPEIALAKRMNEDYVQEIPLMYAADPYSGWMLSEFITRGYEMRKDGIPIDEYAAKNKLFLMDRNSGTTVKGHDCRILVDFGYITRNSAYMIPSMQFDKHTMLDKVDYYNSQDYVNSSEKSVLAKTIQTSIYGKNETRNEFFEQYENNPEFQFYNNAIMATMCINKNQPIPEDLAQDLQTTYEAIGGIGSAYNLVKEFNT